MLPASPSLKLPVWIVTRIDDEAVEHYRSVGCFTPVEDHEPLTVELVQRDDLSPDGDPALTQRNPAQVRMSGIRLSPDEARELTRLLANAVQLIQNAGRQDLPQRIWNRSHNGGYGLAPSSPATQTIRQTA